MLHPFDPLDGLNIVNFILLLFLLVKAQRHAVAIERLKSQRIEDRTEREAKARGLANEHERDHPSA